MRHWLRSVALLLRWIALRKRAELPLIVILQAGMAVGVVVGFSFLVPDLDPRTALYLSTGAPVVGLVTIGMVLVPQNVAGEKRQGIFAFNRSLPVPRSAMIAAEVVVSVSTALPGVAAALLLAAVRFHLHLHIGLPLVLAILLTAVTAAAIGYGYGHALKPTTVQLVSQLVVFVALMFAPVNFPASRLPDWLAAVHRVLPFEYMATAVRGTLLPGAAPVAAFLVLGAWCVAGLGVTWRVMARRE